MGIYGEDFSADGQAPSKAAMAAAAAAAAFMREIPYRKPVRRCCSARQLMCTIRGGADDPPHVSGCNATMVAGLGGGFPARNNSHVHGRRPNGASPGAVSAELGSAGMLPTPKFGGGGGGGSHGGVVANLNLTAAPAYGGARGGLHMGKHGGAGEDKDANRHSVFALFQHHHQGAKEQQQQDQQQQQQQRRESGVGQASADTIDALSALLPPPLPPALPAALPMPSATSFGTAAGAAHVSPAAEAAPGGSGAQPSSAQTVSGSASQTASGSRPPSASASASAAALAAAPPHRGSSDGGVPVGAQAPGVSGPGLSATVSRRISGTGGFTPALGAIQEDERDGSPDTPDRRPGSAQQGAAAADGGSGGGVSPEPGLLGAAAGGAAAAGASRPGSGVRSEAQVPSAGDGAGTAAVDLSPHPSAAVHGDDPATPLLLTRRADGDGDDVNSSSDSPPTAVEAAGAVPLVPPAAPGTLPRPPSAAALASLGSLGGRGKAGEGMASLGSTAHTQYGSAASLVSLAAGVSGASPAGSRPGTSASGGDGNAGAMPPPPPAPLPPPPAPPPPVRVGPPGYDDGTDGG